MTVSPAATAYADHAATCIGWSCWTCEHLAARMAAEADDAIEKEERAARRQATHDRAADALDAV